MNSLVAQQQGYTFPMDEIPRTYYPGRGFLTDQEAYPENPFSRSPRYGGGMNVPGAPGNLGGYAGLPEVIKEIERRQQEYQRKKFEYDMNPDNQPQPYNPETNPVFPDYPFGRPTGTGGFATLPYQGGPMNPTPMPYYAGQDYGGVQLLGASPSFEIPQGQGRNPNYSIYNDPRLPGARNLRRKLEGILGLPKYNFPQAQAPANFDRKFVS
tara:strand:+ start:669 stop:1301 length:633 start_codon:yes stop_codon:yes gene_type:complete